MERGTFIKSLGIFSLGMTGLNTLLKGFDGAPQAEILQPVLFIGHGSPTNAIEKNEFTEMLSKLGAELEKPKAILVVSAHWLTRGTFVAASPKPETIYDFGGFPEEMYSIKYACPGAPDYAKITQEALKSAEAQLNHDWGLDHGAWTILKHIYPKADVPVYELSIDFRKPPQYHYELAGHLKELRKKGVLIIGSGNIVHNLGRIEWKSTAPVFDWAKEFDEKIRKNLIEHNHSEIINYEKWGQISKIAHPSNDHYLPLLYALGLQEKKEDVKFIYEGFQNGSISMRCLKIG